MNRSSHVVAVALLLAASAALHAQAPSSAGGGVAPAYRVLRSVSGTRGEVRNGQYVVLDPRSEFQVPRDSEVLVFFEWLGAPGAHKLSGTWHGPLGTSTTTTFDYTAQDRQFGAYWVLSLPSTIPAGDWTLEASIDGQPAGTHAFTIVTGGSAAVPSTAPGRLPLTRQELYERGLASLVTLEALDAAGARLQSGLGVLISDSAVLTSFAAVNMAATLRIRSRNGATATVDSLWALSYRGGWAIVSVPPISGTSALARATDDIRVGAACFSFDSPGEGAYVLAPGEVSGVNGKSGPEGRLAATFSGLAAPGAPVLNEYGELAGVVPSNVTGRDTLRTALTLGAGPEIGAIVPVSALPHDDAAPQTLAQVAQRGGFVPLVVAARHVLNGGFATGIQGRGPSTMPVDQRERFTRGDRAIVAFVTWMPKERFKGMSSARLYDMENRLLGQSKPLKANMRANDLLFSSWQFPVPQVAGGYRVDVLLGDVVAWRGHFSVTE